MCVLIVKGGLSCFVDIGKTEVMRVSEPILLREIIRLEVIDFVCVCDGVKNFSLIFTVSVGTHAVKVWFATPPTLIKFSMETNYTTPLLTLCIKTRQII